MEIIRSTDAHRSENGPAYTAHEYRTQDPDLNIARVEINGRVPAEGRMRNTKVKEIVYVESGKGPVPLQEPPQDIAEGDVIFYDRNEEVFWEGELVLIIACTPAWSLEQHEMLP